MGEMPTIQLRLDRVVNIPGIKYAVLLLLAVQTKIARRMRE